MVVRCELKCEQSEVLWHLNVCWAHCSIKIVPNSNHTNITHKYVTCHEENASIWCLLHARAINVHWTWMNLPVFCICLWKYLRPWANDRAHNRRYDAVCETVLRTYSIVWIAWWMITSPISSSCSSSCCSTEGFGSSTSSGCSSNPGFMSPLDLVC